MINAVGSLKGAIVYCTHRPCPRCTTKLAAAGVSRIIYLDIYPEEKSSYLIFTAICRASGIEWAKI